MKIEPRTRGFICTTAHPTGCAANVKTQIAYINSKAAVDGPKRVLVIGSSTGFGLASRITAAFSSKAATIGVFFEKPPSEGRTASAGWYNTAAFETEAHKNDLYAKSINGDAFSNEIKAKTLELIKADLGQIDMLIYSLASPVRTHPETGVRYKSTLKPIGAPYSNKTVDFHTGDIKDVAIAPAEGDDIENTITVMGGDDWQLWVNALRDADLLSDGFMTIAYSYIGPKLTEPVYRKGSAIPVIPLYISLLYKIMKAEGLHEGCIEQIYRLYAERLFEDEIPTDEQGRIRIDDWEMRPDIQEQIVHLWEEATTETLPKIGDLAGYKKDFFNLFGFEVEGVDYDKDTDEMVSIPGLIT